MSKADGAFLTIGELAKELNLPQHILRYWESRFPQLKPLQRSGNRRYYRPADVEIARQIHHLLYVERSEEHTSELQSLMRISYAVFCLKKKKTPILHNTQC